MTFHDRGGTYGRTKGAKRPIAVDVSGLPLAAFVVPASTTENAATERLVDELVASGQAWPLKVVLEDRGTSVKPATALSRKHGVTSVASDGRTRPRRFRPIAPAWRVEVAHDMLGRSRRLAKSFENTPVSGSGWLQVTCIATVQTALRTIWTPCPGCSDS